VIVGLALLNFLTGKVRQALIISWVTGRSLSFCFANIVFIKGMSYKRSVFVVASGKKFGFMPSFEYLIIALLWKQGMAKKNGN